jgi:hypothetical protein
VGTRRSSYAHQQNEPVIPGRYDTHQSRTNLETQVLAEYESWIIGRMGIEYREQCLTLFCKLPASNPGLPPPLALRAACFQLILPGPQPDYLVCTNCGDL